MPCHTILHLTTPHHTASKVPLAPFADTPDLDAVKAAGDKWGYPFMLKARKGGYEGLPPHSHSTSFFINSRGDLMVVLRPPMTGRSAHPSSVLSSR